jgi:ligand-binding SRPBCC domain-containing protein
MVMEIFHAETRLRAPVQALADFHARPGALKKLTPPPVLVQVHAADPLAEGARADFTMWFGPLPVRWLAIHSQVEPLSGFTDTQVQGPLKHWVHRHTWSALEAAGEKPYTLLVDHIEYEHHPGLHGLLTRLLFARPLLGVMFAYRHWVTRRAVENRPR